jgi:hypothetical protein
MRERLLNDLASMKPSTTRLYLVEIVWQKAFDEGNLDFERREGKAYFKFKSMRQKDWEITVTMRDSLPSIRCIASAVFR